MKNNIVATTFIALFSFIHCSEASFFAIDISPNGGALNLGATTYTQDHRTGLSALNAVGQPASSATGGEIGAGIVYDDVSNLLSFEFGYGSDFGFVDLQGDWSNTHAHGPDAVSFPAPNVGAGVIPGQTLTAAHIPGSTARTGSFVGTWTLSDSDEQDLFDNEIYINIHSGFAGGGEIRGQMIPVAVIPEPSTLALLSSSLVGLFLFRKKRS